MIAMAGLSKRFGRVAALADVSTEIPAGGFALLLGANGAGKTTLLRCVLGLHAYEGTVRVGGHDVARDGRAARALVGYVPQRPALPGELTCAEVLDLFARLRGRSPRYEWLDRVGLAESASTPARVLSGGMRQRLALAAAMQGDPPVLLFDEPAASLDVAARRALHRDLAALSEAGRTVVLSTHLAAEPLAAATRALVLDRGRLVYDGAPAALGAAIRQRVVFTMNGAGRDELRALIAGRPEVQLDESSGAVVATTPAGRAFELLAAVASAGIPALAVRVEEPSVDPSLVVASGGQGS
ncbi:MAG: ABC transporter ATP-binding protein [Armatimonadota bacterium]|nr:ABC transporter ATP-binding protein [Armatimonadota bacterium]MDR7422294.1 ABC transporter ATP-binding protein [Armatimonadota bacterium]MDR7453754.1 ABC transporter ATP-binding protein [Armatimonadota bacterium]MDR7456283.1 ABC transporter ATP-binding protein [Armatimonadota bacterium]MDR7496280.1 ABC transporter ATP-binding protein [Armatimonadota bacterium]